MKYTKDGVIEDLSPNQIKKYTMAGWAPVVEQVKAEDEVIRLKPTVKTKNTAKILDEANTKGDE